MTAEEFIGWDEAEIQRSEFVRGEVFAMAGAEERHVTVSGNVYIALRNHLRGSPCRTFMADMKLRVEAADCFFYPDVMVTCSAGDTRDTKIKRHSVLVVEVLPPSTAAYDRGAKFADYRRLPSLAGYLLIDTDSRRCDLYRKGAEALWDEVDRRPRTEPRQAAPVQATGPVATTADEPASPAMWPHIVSRPCALAR